MTGRARTELRVANWARTRPLDVANANTPTAKTALRRRKQERTTVGPIIAALRIALPSARRLTITDMPVRRDFLKSLATLPAVAAALAQGENLPPVRALTRGPKFHWFGYYDKLQFDPTSRYVLGMEVGFEHRYPGARRRDRGGHDRPGGRRPLDRPGREPRLVLAAGLHAAMAPRLEAPK